MQVAYTKATINHDWLQSCTIRLCNFQVLQFELKNCVIKFLVQLNTSKQVGGAGTEVCTTHKTINLLMKYIMHEVTSSHMKCLVLPQTQSWNK